MINCLFKRLENINKACSTWSQKSDAAAPSPSACQLTVEPSGQCDLAQCVQGRVSHTHHIQMVLVDVNELLEVM